jgi:alpha-amylase/alpha-mannosidase (GH57 family)
MNMNKFICIHGHFYQPPRENPWLEDIELQDSAYPFHDWNERISEECYKANAASRILDKEGNIVSIVNNYTQISYNFGPTLLSWMQKHQPEIYQSILEADKESQERFNGHGSAIAQPYNHMIMPLANQQDKYTQVYWGIKDFKERFGRDPEGMWLPETAVNYDTLEILADLGIKYTILAPHQAARIRKKGKNTTWQEIKDANIDYRKVYLCPLPSGKLIHIFFYNGALAHEVSFGDLLRNGEKFANRLVDSFSKDENPELVHIATDGETFGHHHRFGEMALSYCLYHIEENKLARITNYGEYLELHPPNDEVQIVENTSWSCVHGIERWRNDCGCHTGSSYNTSMVLGWNQQWRKPLREAMDWLRDQVIKLFEKGASVYLKDVWQARNEYITTILDRNPERIKNFLNQSSSHSLSQEETIQAIKYLEMQRNAMLMYTSCGWFFDDISGIETTQIMRYAARCIQLARELDKTELESKYIKILEQAPSNVSRYKNGAEVYQLLVQPVIVDLLRVGAHYAISALFNGKQKTIYAYQILQDQIERRENGQLKMAIGRAVIKSEITLEEDNISFAVIHLGDHNVNGGVRSYQGEQYYQEMVQKINSSFDQANVADIIHLIDKHFGTNSYSLWHLFKDEQRKVIQMILKPNLERAESDFVQIYTDNQTMMNFLKQLNIPIPNALFFITEQALNKELKQVFSHKLIDLDKLEDLIQEVQCLGIRIDHTTLSFTINSWVNRALIEINKQPNDICRIQEIASVLEQLKEIDLQLHPWKAQNIYFQMKQEIMPTFQEKVNQEDEQARAWLEQFKKLGMMLNIGMS